MKCNIGLKAPKLKVSLKSLKLVEKKYFERHAKKVFKNKLLNLYQTY